jgi:hypothetical protein
MELNDYDDVSRTCNILFTPSSRGTKKIIFTNRKSNVNKTPIKKLQGDNRERRKTESVSACHEQDQLGITVARFGGLSQTAKLDLSKPCHFSKMSLSGRWRNKYLEEVRERKVEKKCKVNVRLSMNSSVYSDIDATDSDSDPSCLDPEKPYFTHSSRRTKKIILTNRKSNVNKTLIKKLQDGKRKRRKTESVSACYEQDQLGVTVSRFGGLSQTAKLNVPKPCHFFKKILHGRVHNQYLNEERKREIEKCKVNVQDAVYSSAYSDTFDTDSDSVLSWLEPEKSKRLLVCQKPEKTYEKRRTTFQRKWKKKETIVTKHRKIFKSKTRMNVMSEGPCTRGDGRTMTVKGITEADGK